MAHNLQQALGGRIIVLSRLELLAAAEAGATASQEANRAKLPRPQRPDLAREDYPPAPADQTQGLIVHWGHPTGSDPIAAGDIDEAFLEAIESAGLGVADGDEHGPEGVIFYYYGPDAEAMLAAIRPVLAQLPVPPASYVTMHDDDRPLRREELPATGG